MSRYHSHSIPNPTRTLTVSASLAAVRTAILEATNTMDYYKLLNDDDLMNTISVHIAARDGVSVFRMDQGQTLHISLQLLTIQQTKVDLVISRNVGGIDESFEIEKANAAMDGFILLIGGALRGNMDDAIASVRSSDRRRNWKSNLLLVFCLTALAVISYIYLKAWGPIFFK